MTFQDCLTQPTAQVSADFVPCVDTHFAINRRRDHTRDTELQHSEDKCCTQQTEAGSMSLSIANVVGISTVEMLSTCDFTIIEMMGEFVLIKKWRILKPFARRRYSLSSLSKDGTGLALQKIKTALKASDRSGHRPADHPRNHPHTKGYDERSFAREIHEGTPIPEELSGHKLSSSGNCSICRIVS